MTQIVSVSSGHCLTEDGSSNNFTISTAIHFRDSPGVTSRRCRDVQHADTYAGVLPQIRAYHNLLAVFLHRADGVLEFLQL